MTPNINPLDLLTERVTPQVVDQSQLDIDIDKKSSLLKQFYPIMLALFHKFPDRLQNVLDGRSAPLQELFGTHQGELKQLLEGFSTHHSLQPATIETLFNHAIPLSARTLQEEAGQEGIVSYLGAYMTRIREQLPAWAVPILASLGISGLVHTTNAQTVRTVPADTGGGGFKKWLPWLALLILILLLLFLWRSCQKQEPAPENVAPAPEQHAQPAVAQNPASLRLTSGTDNQILACQSNVGDDNLSSTIQTALIKVFGTQATCKITKDQAYATSLDGQDKLEPVLNLVKTIPNASVEWVGDHLTVNAPDEATLKTLVDQIIAVAPELKVVPAQPLNVEQSVNDSIEASNKALSGLDETSRPQDIIRALNLQIINFASGSAAIPDSNKAILDQAAVLLQEVPNLALNIEGYTDSTGSAELNKTLSQQRAQAVMDYLAEKGVNTSNLKAVGYGPENPVADNVTELGKFKNRRIEFALAETPN